MLENLTLHSFEPHLGSVFRLPDAEGVTLTLAEASPASFRMPDGSPMKNPRAPFRLLFCGPQSPSLTQQIHRLQHDAMGTLEIFLVPIGPAGDGLGYEAIFS